MITDTLAAVITYLKAWTPLAALVSTRIYGAELPEADVSAMPRACIVLRLAGGVEVFRSDKVLRPRMDCWCYGDGFFQAGQIDREVVEAMGAIRRAVASSALLQSAGVAGGPFQIREPDTGWPYVVRSYTILTDERVAS